MIELPPQPSTPSPGGSSGSASQTGITANQSPSLGNDLLKQLQQGQTLAAKVMSVKTLSTADKTLLQQTNPSLAQQLSRQLSQQLTTKIGKASDNIQLSTAETNLSSTLKSLTPAITQQLLAKNTLYLAKLLISLPDKTSRPITTVTPEALTPKQDILIGHNKQQLIFSKPQTVETIAAQTLKQSLPLQQAPRHIQEFATRIQQLPPKLISQLTNQPTLDGLKSLTGFNYTANNLGNPQQVQQAINNSGVFLENKLLTQQQPTQDLRAVLDKVNAGLNHQSTTESQTAKGFEKKELENLLINLLQPTKAVARIADNKALTQAIAQLFRLLGVPLPANQPTTADLPKIIQVYIKQLVEQTQARIQFNQLRSLFPEQMGSETKTAGGPVFHTELTLRYNEQLLPLQISIREQYESEDNEKNNQDKENSEEEKKIGRRWQVVMSFELPDNEKLHTQLSIVEENVSATLWAESATLCQHAEQQLQYLRDKLLANGLNIEELICLQGKPTQQEFSLGYNLIDITT